jgi:hypothetical protein
MNAVPTKTELIDLFWRSIWTFVGAFGGGTVVINIADWDIDATKLAAISGGGAVFTLLKAYASNKLGTGTATSKTEASVGLNPVASNSATPA